MKLQPTRDSADHPNISPILHRMAKLTKDVAVLDAVAAMSLRSRRVLPPRSELMQNRQGLPGVLALEAGWAGHAEVLADGRRQIMHLLLPGEIISYPRPGRTLAWSTVIALTPVAVCQWDIGLTPAQHAMLGANDAIEQRCLANQITRMGRRSSLERMSHLLLEIRERLALAGLATHDAFPLPLTQETLADVLGLTSVHINRVLQQMRQERHIRLRGGMVELLDPKSLARIADYHPLMQGAL